MKLVRRLDQFRTFASGRTRLGEFECPVCLSLVVRNISNGPRQTSCGCMARRGVFNPRFRHGLSKHPLYGVWSGVWTRCTNPKRRDFCRYGGRGIKVCEAWRDFAEFAQWCQANGWQPGLTLDRIDNDGDYTPYNCRFVTNQINSQHSRRCKLTIQAVKAIRRALLKGQSKQRLAKRYSVSLSTIEGIYYNRTWRNVFP